MPLTFLDELEPRVRAAFALRFLAGSMPIPRASEDEAASEAAIRAAVAALRAAFVSDPVAAGLHAEPAFPGLTAGIERVGSRYRLVSACRIRAGDDDLGVAIVVVVGGRAVDVTLAPPSTPIPTTWTAAASI